MHELLSKLFDLALRSPYFVGQLMLSALLSIGCAVFVVSMLDNVSLARGVILTKGAYDVVLLASLFAMTVMMGVLLFLITKSSVRGTMASANEIVAEVGEVASLTRGLTRRRVDADESTRGGLSLDVFTGTGGMLSEASYDAHGLEVVREVEDRVTLDLEERDVQAAREEHAEA